MITLSTSVFKDPKCFQILESSEAQIKIKSDWFLKTFPENHSSIDLILAQFYLLFLFWLKWFLFIFWQKIYVI
jgi:hypothetical protein